MPLNLPVLYSFRRCPYAIRARMALLYASINVELREVLLREKPPSMLAISAKGTVPVLQLHDGTVLDQSCDIMHWALAQSDPQQWLRADLAEVSGDLISRNDNQFKHDLDSYKYWPRFDCEDQNVPGNASQITARDQCELFLVELEQRLSRRPYLLAEQLTIVDIALFPFVRQFAFVDKEWFDQSPYPALRAWLQQLLDSELFLRAMKKSSPWQDGDVPITLLKDHSQSITTFT